MGNARSRPGCLRCSCACLGQGEEEDGSLQDRYVPRSSVHDTKEMDQRLKLKQLSKSSLRKGDGSTMSRNGPLGAAGTLEPRVPEWKKLEERSSDVHKPVPGPPRSWPEPKRKKGNLLSWKPFMALKCRESLERRGAAPLLEVGTSNTSLQDKRESSATRTRHPGQPDHGQPVSTFLKGSLSDGHQETLEACGAASAVENSKVSGCLSEEVLDGGLDLLITSSLREKTESELRFEEDERRVMMEEQEEAKLSQRAKAVVVAEEQSCCSPGGAGSPLASSACCTQDVGPEWSDTDSLLMFLELEQQCLHEDEGDGADPGCLEGQVPDPACGKLVERQHKLEEALLLSGQYLDTLQALGDWLYTVHAEFPREQTIGGHLALVLNLMDAHLLFQNELVKHMEKSWDDRACVKVQLPEQSEGVDTVSKVFVSKEAHQEEALKQMSQDSQRRDGSSSVEDDEHGHPICQTGDVLSARYEVVATLGEGTFGQVVECIDHQEKGRHVAVKIVKDESFPEEAYQEIQILGLLKASDPGRTHHCVQMLDWFQYRGHVSIVFELLGLSTYDLMEKNGFLPFRLDHIRHMGYQICEAVNFLHLHELTHTDLKPDNILFVTSDYTEEYNPRLKRKECRLQNPDVKVADFGCAVYDHEYHSSVVSARPYRAPEVVLGLGWSQPCDVWSIGCILLEYYVGFPVFMSHEGREHLAMMEQTLGPLPHDMIKKSRKHEYFHHGRLDWDKQSTAGRHVSRRCVPLKGFMVSRDEDHKNLFDLIKKMLWYDPAQRITLGEALEHPFFSH